MENRLSVRKRDQADEAYAAQILELMGLYSAAIEYHNTNLDEENQAYYVEKMNDLN